MTDINQTILKKASGENRLKPDEQRYYLGTYKERVLLTVKLTDVSSDPIKNHFSHLLSDFQAKETSLTLKISGKLDDSLQLFYLKLAQESGIASSIIDEVDNSSPLGLVLHTNHAINQEKLDIKEQFPNIIQKPSPSPKASQKTFWSKLFGR
ncbi:YueI family protein [Streptococcus merionis]|uniref:Glycogen synthase n=1 Tax=Streptococcus merionis TaxID=400065 RepID=A0A239STR6_9STRE|nr:YueI family protein [Streptococcus merionis]SNU88134.1 glycogen synthase [Streptococcus merionis]